MNRASPAESCAAAELCSRKFERIAQHPQQRCFRRDAYFFLAAVDAKREVSHVFSKVGL
jgi:hypothetical protein